ncbi:hypothetical protein HIM_10580 [Hirsutella minnesotensis 3608]|uniref:Transcription activator GCR1-like domain-containing protein n=1 Tax=Hirsutella minnesotensis 3608 TaxID=1043627 RepID=A0A0F8A243_9HYPO|nr:hypothetical protein HIM_10580 [Hirsutella minnesotensis 3608]
MRPEWLRRRTPTSPVWMKDRHVITLAASCPPPQASPARTDRTVQIRRAGRWNNGDQMTGCYLTSLPFEFMRAVADFDPEWSGSYFVPRATVRPPVVLLVQVWPQLDKWKEAHSSPLSDFGVEQNMAAGAFLELMEWLREVLLQDAVFLQESYPDHPLFQDPVFSCPEFAAHSTAIQKAMPVVAEKLRTVLTQQVAAEQLAERRHANLLTVARDLCAKLEEFAQTTCTVTFSPGRGTAAQQTEVMSARQGRRRAAGDAITSAMGPPSAARPQNDLEKQREEHVQVDKEKALDEASDMVTGRSQPPSFRLPRSIGSVQDLMHLWRQGWGDMPSVDSLERDWGTRWRLSEEKTYFSTRKIIVNEVRRRAQLDGLAEGVVARQMDEEWGFSSLDKLFKAIRRSRSEPVTRALAAT